MCQCHVVIHWHIDIGNNLRKWIKLNLVTCAAGYWTTNSDTSTSVIIWENKLTELNLITGVSVMSTHIGPTTL